MSTDSHDDCPSRERLSALLDGETRAEASAAACASWCDEAGARRDWHAWHLIGDVLRSDELASGADHDARFLATLRGRLASEPLPAASNVVTLDGVRAARAPSRWMIPSAMAAGVLLVMGTFALVRPGQSVTDAATTIATAPSAAPALATATASPGEVRVAGVGVGEPNVVTDHRMLRDAALSDYLAAHKQFAGTTALGVPSAFLRRATVETPAR